MTIVQKCNRSRPMNHNKITSQCVPYGTPVPDGTLQRGCGRRSSPLPLSTKIAELQPPIAALQRDCRIAPTSVVTIARRATTVSHTDEP